jgi:hypothetical protein
MKKTTEYFAIAADTRIMWPTVSESGQSWARCNPARTLPWAVTLETPLSTKVASATP